uniref:Uncharacterized protein n=1 Tax=Tetraselmis sp. GSL018 TaxID=582737 RepID=A0A061QU53_9CHLO
MGMSFLDDVKAELRYHYSRRALSSQVVPDWRFEVTPEVIVTGITFSAALHRACKEARSSPTGVLALVAANCAAFIKPGGYRCFDVALIPWCVWKRREYYRLVVPVFIHGDFRHLLGTLASLVSDGIPVERRKIPCPCGCKWASKQRLVCGSHVS